MGTRHNTLVKFYLLDPTVRLFFKPRCFRWASFGLQFSLQLRVSCLDVPVCEIEGILREKIIRACVPKKFFYTLYLILFNTLTLTHTAAIFKMTDKITWGRVTFAFQPPSLLGLCIFGCNVIIKLMKLTLIWICTVII